MASTETLGQEFVDIVKEAWGEVTTLADEAVSALKTSVSGLVSWVTADQFVIVSKVAAAVEAKMAAGATFEEALSAGLNELVIDEKAEVTKIEMAILQSLVRIHMAG